jgi:Domain of Unknown Function (DUF928)
LANQTIDRQIAVVKGFVQRIARQPTLNSDLANPDPMTWLEVYAKNEIWYETLAT